MERTRQRKIRQTPLHRVNRLIKVTGVHDLTTAARFARGREEINMKQTFTGTFRDNEGRLWTANMAPGVRVYGEALSKKEGREYREWDPTRSKLAAAITNGMKTQPMKENHIVLYLGASTGTTVSHVSDILTLGFVYAIEFAERVFRNLTDLTKGRKNIAPLLVDARKPEMYAWLEACDSIFCDIAQPEETEIAIRNAKAFLKDKGLLMIAIKSRSIDVTKAPEQVYKQEAAKLKAAGFEVLEVINLEPHEKDHALIVCRK